MKEYLSSLIPKIRNYSLEIDKLSKLYDQPWVLVNELDNFIKLIFQAQGKLIVSKNGVVSDGAWELVSVANAILLDINNEKRLYNHQFIDSGLMILKLDGLSNDYFILANQNIIPNLNVEQYLIAKYSNAQGKSVGEMKSNHISKSREKDIPASPYQLEHKLTDDRMFKIVNHLGYSGRTEVRIDEKIPSDGLFRLTDKAILYEVKDGKLVMEYFIGSFRQEDGTIIEIAGNRLTGIGKGSFVFKNGVPAPNGTYQKGWLSKIKVENGVIV